ncbi:hypothetical protein BpHYR1_042951 [Brachionus plicatilis]|uniref:Uncharacterized protein n=1 Tax=Brachionus plicatilis TaxID=10195 RepID=A0A3M7SMR1_BRAPC|nr:hypothetical protein BpHYR1_042951 [Brachionus plicatilis]
MHLGKDNPKQKYFLTDQVTGETVHVEETTDERDLGLLQSNTKFVKLLLYLYLKASENKKNSAFSLFSWKKRRP